MAAPADGTDLEASLLSFEKLDRASPDLWPEQLPGVAEFAASFKSPITSSPPKWMAELENDDIDMLKESPAQEWLYADVRSRLIFQNKCARVAWSSVKLPSSPVFHCVRVSWGA